MSGSDASLTHVRSLFDGYDPGFGVWDEAFAGTGEPRHQYLRYLDQLGDFTVDELRRRSSMRDAMFRSRGITFTVYGDDAGAERLLLMDLVPRIIPSADWALLEAGLIQRVQALNLFLDDLYDGENTAVRDGVVPDWIVTTSDGFCREAFGVPAPGGVRALVAGIDVVRDADGKFLVLEDNLRNPSGVSYVLENREVMKRLFPRVSGAHRIRPVDNYGPLLLAALQAVAPGGAGDPSVAVLTPGTMNSAYFEHAFLAREMGAELVEGSDLIVDDHVVSMRTTRGLQRVDVIYRRLDDRFLDPVGFKSESMIGVPGLLAAARAGNVTLANAIGNGAADDKAIYCFVPDLIRHYLAAEPLIDNVATYRLWEPDQLEEALGRLDQLVIKPVAGSGGYGIVIGPAATDEELAETRAAILEDPRGWIAQEVVQLSRIPTMTGEGLGARHVDLRPFVISRPDGVDVMPGGLTRVALQEGSLIVNSSQGGGSKDTWVLLDEEAG
ncbi:MAG: circularly permuted type 2 ATP-grasp protein [Actinomycetota bacterium]